LRESLKLRPSYTVPGDPVMDPIHEKRLSPSGKADTELSPLIISCVSSVCRRLVTEVPSPVPWVPVDCLVDEVGIDVAAHVAKELGEAFGERFSGGDPAMLNAMVEKGYKGRKSGKGCFIYSDSKSSDGGRPVNPGASEIFKRFSLPSKGLDSEEDIQLRLVTRFVNEAAYCLQDGILKNPLEGDIGAVFGLGFPPMTGGPFRYADSMGANILVGHMKRFEAQYGAAFTPCQLLEDMAKSGEKFHKA